jgi:hypothetical protein
MGNLHKTKPEYPKTSPKYPQTIGAAITTTEYRGFENRSTFILERCEWLMSVLATSSSLPHNNIGCPRSQL